MSQWIEILGGAVLFGLLLNVVLMGVAVVVLGLMPTDYFSRARRPRRLWIRYLRNACGAILAALGALMLVAPGPGLVMVVSGLMLIDSPKKTKLLERILCRPGVFDTVSRMRAWFGKPSLSTTPEMQRRLDHHRGLADAGRQSS